MQCVIPTCDHDASITSSPEITYFKFPIQLSIRTAWLKALRREGWQPEENSAVCSKHFLQDDVLQSSNGLRRLRPGAVPVVNVQVCRICFALDCTLYPMTAYTILYKAYETLTGSMIGKDDKLPPYLCNECAHHLLKCAHFHTKIIEAHSILLEIYMKHNCITLESIKSVHGVQNSLNSNFLHNQSDMYNIDLELTHMENINADQTDTRHISLFEDITIDCIKVEHDDVSHNDEVLTKDVLVCLSARNLHKDTGDNGFKKDDGVYTVLSNSHGAPVEGVTMDASFSLEERHNTNQSTTEVHEVTRPEVINHLDFDTIRQPVAESRLSISDSSLPLEEVNLNVKPIKAGEQDMTRALEDINHTNADIHRKLGGKNNLLFNGKLLCGMCPFQTTSKINLSSHLKAHAAPKSYSCSMCNYKTVYNRSLIWHSRVHSGEKPYPCDYCNKTFSQKGSLLVHMRQHSGKKPYLCNVCKRTFTELSTLRRHLRTHSGEKPYVCDVCKKAFRQKGHLKNHLRVHAGEKPYICDYCRKAFSQKGHLKTHLRVHSDDQQHACDICNKIFRHDNTLKRHMRKHSSKKSYSCETCKKVFSRRSCLRVHLKKHSIEKSL